MRRILVLGFLLALAPAMTAMADRCVGPMDTSMSGAPYNITPFAAADIVWCDDFDTYCSSHYNSTDRTLSTFWPGYPPSPDTTLCTSANPNDDGRGLYEWMMKEGYWSQAPTQFGPNGWSPNGGRGAWPPGGATAGSANYGVSNADYGSSGLRLEGWNGNSGYASLPYVAQQPGNNATSGMTAYYEYLMADGIAHKFTGGNAVNGTDANPLVLRYWTNDNANLGAPAGWGKPPNWPFYMELALDTDRAPTDFIMAATQIQQCTNEGVNFPIVCAQYLNPTGCPDRTTFPLAEHSSIAFGWLAPLDTNPCDVETGRKPTMYHAATFNGKYWRALVSNQNPGSGDFNYDMQMGFFEITVKSTTYDVRLIAPTETGTGTYSIVTNTATGLTRQYTGPFNKVGMGIGPGCELDATTGACVSGTTPTNTHWNWDWSPGVYVDRPVVFGGVSNVTKGACCVQTGENAGTCTDGLLESECTGVWRGPNTLCATSPVCCPMPFADADHDGDVDQDDFGAFQVCYTGTGGGVPTGCACYDRDSSSAVDSGDVQAFLNCWTGPNVPWTALLTPNCVN